MSPPGDSHPSTPSVQVWLCPALLYQNTQVLVDGINVASINVKCLRRQLALVGQEPVVFRWARPARMPGHPGQA